MRGGTSQCDAKAVEAGGHACLDGCMSEGGCSVDGIRNGKEGQKRIEGRKRKRASTKIQSLSDIVTITL